MSKQTINKEGNSEEMDFETAFEKYKQGDRSEDVKEAILQEDYAFLEYENFHSAIEVIEALTGIEFK